MSGMSGDLIDLTSPHSGTPAPSSPSIPSHGAPLGRTSTRGSQHSGGAGEREAGATAGSGLAGLISNVFGGGWMRESNISSDPSYTINSSNTPSAEPSSASTGVGGASSLPPPIPAATSSTSPPGRSPNRPTIDLPPAATRFQYSSASGSNGVSGSSSYTNQTAFNSNAASAAGTIPQSSYGPQSAAATQARLKTLPRLESYRVDRSSSGSGSALSRIESRDSETGGDDDGHDTTTSLSGTETEHDTEDVESETDDDEDEDDEDRPHGEQDVRGGVASMRRNLQRPALPTLSSTRGFSRSGSTPFMSPPQQQNPFSGWTTFATSTPTPGPMRTARPQPGDNMANGSYFDARPLSSSSRTPAQTPKPLAGDSPARSLRSPVSSVPRTPGGMSPQASRIRAESRQFASPAERQGATPVQPSTPILAAGGQAIPPSAIPAIPGTSQPASPSRPSFYQRQSRSLVDLSRSLDIDSPKPSSRPLSRPGSSTDPALFAVPAGASPIIAPAEESGDAAASHEEAMMPPAQAEVPEPDLRDPSPVSTPSAARTVQRRQSMPEMRIDPPVYSIDDDFFVQYREGQVPVSREEEGREPLPGYSCDVHIEGYVPRKMEFLKPGLQAKDRRWKRQYVILHGTSIKVYRSDPRSKPVAGQDAPPSPGIHKADVKPEYRAGSSKASSSASLNTGRLRSATNASASSQSSAALSTTSRDSEKSISWNPKQQTAAAGRQFDPDVPVHVHQQEDEEGGLASLQHPGALLAKASENRVVRHYTLQGAESGLAADYLKRRHVVRIRAEGEQFLVQAKDDRNVIDWIEALQAATNTALDLDVRPLPKFITLPRRRRRRRPADPAAPATTAAAAAGTASAPATSTGRSTPSNQVTARTDAMNNMLAEDQENYLSRPGGMVS